MCPKRLAINLLLTTFIAFGTGCMGIDSSSDSGGADTGSTNNTGSGGNTGSAGSTVPDNVATASMFRAVADYDGTYRVTNVAAAILDVDRNPIPNLDGGDFEVIPSGASEPDPEGHHDAQKLDQVTGKITLMLDVSDSMDVSRRFEELKGAAKSFVSKSLALGLPVDVYAFDSAEQLVGSFPVGTTDATVASAIDGLALGDTTTYFYDTIANRITTLVTPGVNGLSYTHTAPPSTPYAHVELMVIMSDGQDNSQSGSAAAITSAKDKRFSVFTIAVGDNPNETEMETYSEFVFTVPDNGTYADAVNEAVTTIGNYYRSFYLIDYIPTVIDGGEQTFAVKLVGNESAALNVTYDPTLLSTLPKPAPVCCKIRLTPSADPSNVTVAAGTSLQMQAVRLWTSDQPWFTWTLANTDGGMSLDVDPDPSFAVLNAINSGSTGAVTVEDSASGWTQSVPVSVQ